jgi:hypothetical protein
MDLDLQVEAVQKYVRHEALTEQDKIVIFDTLFSDCKRWAPALCESVNLSSQKHPKILIGAHCWDKLTSAEMNCVSVNTEDGSGVFEELFGGGGGGTRSIRTHPLDSITTQSPFGNYVYLRDVSVGSKFYKRDNQIWKPHILRSKDSEYVRCSGPTGGSVVFQLSALDDIVSFFPPEWAGSDWSFDPFTHEVWIQQYGNSYRSKNKTEITRWIRTFKIPGLTYVHEFLTGCGDFVFKVPGVSYVKFDVDEEGSRWTDVDSSSCSSGSSGSNVIPAHWKHGICATVSGYSIPTLRRAGWFMTPNGLRFAGTNWTISYGTRRSLQLTSLVITMESFDLKFDNLEDLQAFDHAYSQNSFDYVGH